MLAGSLKRRIERALLDSAEEEPGGSSSTAPASGSRGSLRRRLDRASGSTADAETAARLPLTEKMKMAWASGKMSSVRIQEFAQAAEEQGARDMTTVSSSGTGGVWPQNIQRSLQRLFGKPLGSPPISWIKLPTKRGVVAHPVFMPHLFFSSLYAERKDLFNEWMRGPKGAAKTFWDHMKDTPLMRDHGSLKEEKLPQTLPIGFHGDGGCFSKQDNLMVLSWNSICGALGMDGVQQENMF